MSAVWDFADFDDHEHVHMFRDRASGLTAVIAVHSTHLGPGAGGVRYWHYPQRAAALGVLGADVRNDAKSLVVNQLSVGCAACQTSLGSVTFFLSLKCHRNCFFCFNPNQENYEYYRTHTIDLLPELHKLSAAGQPVHSLALTGGEPQLY